MRNILPISIGFFVLIDTYFFNNFIDMLQGYSFIGTVTLSDCIPLTICCLVTIVTICVWNHQRKEITEYEYIKSENGLMKGILPISVGFYFMIDAYFLSRLLLKLKIGQLYNDQGEAIPGLSWNTMSPINYIPLVIACLVTLVAIMNWVYQKNEEKEILAKAVSQS